LAEDAFVFVRSKVAAPAHRVTVAATIVALASASLILAACGRTDRAPSDESRGTGGAVRVDDFGDTVRTTSPAQRIASLNPTTTEILYAIGAGSRVVGRTTWDAYPAEARNAPDLGPGLHPNVEAILASRPDLVLLYASEDNRAAAHALQAAGIRTLTLRIDRIADFSRAMTLIGAATGDSAAAQIVRDSVIGTLDRVRRAMSDAPRLTVAWRLYDMPLLVAGGGSFLSELVAIAGGRNIYDDRREPSPTVSFEDLVTRDPDVILVGPDAAKKVRDDAAWRGLRAVREHHVLSPDTALVTRPAVRLGEAAVSLAKLLHPERPL
jgi:ABC-type Fe3+-hydroxamate transport system substrate-binding protein